MTNYKPYTVYEEDEEFVIRVTKADFKKAEINNVLKNYFDFIEITKKSKATKKRPSCEKRLISLCFLLSGVGQQRDGTGALDGLGKLTLMLGAVAAHTAGHDLAALVDVAAHTGVHITELLVVDVFDLIDTERTNLAARLTAARTACSTIFRHGSSPFFTSRAGFAN